MTCNYYNKVPLFFWFNLSLEATAEIHKKNSLVFWSKRWQQKDISKLTDIYVVQHTAFLTSHCFHLWHKVYSYCTFKKYFLLFTRSSNVYFIILVLGKSSKVHVWNNKICIWKYFLMFLELINIFELSLIFFDFRRSSWIKFTFF